MCYKNICDVADQYNLESIKLTQLTAAPVTTAPGNIPVAFPTVTTSPPVIGTLHALVSTSSAMATIPPVIGVTYVIPPTNGASGILPTVNNVIPMTSKLSIVADYGNESNLPRTMHACMFVVVNTASPNSNKVIMLVSQNNVFWSFVFLHWRLFMKYKKNGLNSLDIDGEMKDSLFSAKIGTTSHRLYVAIIMSTIL